MGSGKDTTADKVAAIRVAYEAAADAYGPGRVIGPKAAMARLPATFKRTTVKNVIATIKAGNVGDAVKKRVRKSMVATEVAIGKAKTLLSKSKSAQVRSTPSGN